MSYFLDPQAIVYHLEISPRQTDIYFKIMISFSPYKQSLKKKLTIKMQSLKIVKSKLEGGLHFDSTSSAWSQGQKEGLLSTGHPKPNAKYQQQPNILPSYGHYSAFLFCQDHPNTSELVTRHL